MNRLATTPVKVLVADDNRRLIETVSEKIEDRLLEPLSGSLEILSTRSATQADQMLREDGIPYGIIDGDFDGGKSGLDVLESGKDLSAVLVGLTEKEEYFKAMVSKGFPAFMKTNIDGCVEHIAKNILISKHMQEAVEEAVTEREEEIRSLKDVLRVRTEALETLAKTIREPHLDLRLKSGLLMIVCSLLWVVWKFSGYVVLSPAWSVIGAFVGLCFFIMSFVLKYDESRIIRKHDVDPLDRRSDR